MNEFYFMRHGHHIPTQDEPTFAGLTSRGCDEARSLAGHFSGLKNVAAYSVDNEYSMASVALALLPETSNESADTIVDSLRKSNVLHPDEDLSYYRLGYADQEFSQAMNQAFRDGTLLRFFVEESDDYLQQNPNLSTYSTMTAVIKKKLSRTRRQAEIYCAKEFFVPVFRARMIERKLGATAVTHYVDYYCSELEWNPKARQMVTRIRHDNDEFILEDSYGVLEFSKRDLLNIDEGKD